MSFYLTAVRKTSMMACALLPSLSVLQTLVTALCLCSFSSTYWSSKFCSRLFLSSFFSQLLSIYISPIDGTIIFDLSGFVRRLGEPYKPLPTLGRS